MSAIGKYVVELGYKYLETHGLNDTDENWEKAMKVICTEEEENIDELFERRIK